MHPSTHLEEFWKLIVGKETVVIFRDNGSVLSVIDKFVSGIWTLKPQNPLIIVYFVLVDHLRSNILVVITIFIIFKKT